MSLAAHLQEGVDDRGVRKRGEVAQLLLLLGRDLAQHPPHDLARPRLGQACAMNFNLSSLSESDTRLSMLSPCTAEAPKVVLEHLSGKPEQHMLVFLHLHIKSLGSLDFNVFPRSFFNVRRWAL